MFCSVLTAEAAQSSLLPILSSMPSWKTPALMLLLRSGIDIQELGMACLPRECHEGGGCLVLVLVGVAWASSHNITVTLGGSVLLWKNTGVAGALAGNM